MAFWFYCYFHVTGKIYICISNINVIKFSMPIVVGYRIQGELFLWLANFNHDSVSDNNKKNDPIVFSFVLIVQFSNIICPRVTPPNI